MVFFISLTRYKFLGLFNLLAHLLWMIFLKPLIHYINLITYFIMAHSQFMGSSNFLNNIHLYILDFFTTVIHLSYLGSLVMVAHLLPMGFFGLVIHLNLLAAFSHITHL